jgi:hypothetical protein
MRVTGRILGLCLAAAWTSAALADPALAGGSNLRASHPFNSDAPQPSTGLVHTQAPHAGDEPGVDPKSCPGLAVETLQPISSNLRLAADLQAPRLQQLSPRHIGGPLGDDVHSAGVRTAVMDTSDKGGGLTAVPGQAASLKVRALNGQERSTYGLTEGGLLVTAVDTTAARAGFRTGDVVLMLDGVSLTSTAQFYKLMHQLPTDRPVPVLVHRSTSDLFLPLDSPNR